MSSSPSSSSSNFVLQLNLLFLLISLCVMKRERDADSEEKIAERAEALRERFLLERREKRRKERVLVYKSLLRDVEEGVDIFALIQNPHEASLASPRLASSTLFVRGFVAKSGPASSRKNWPPRIRELPLIFGTSLYWMLNDLDYHFEKLDTNLCISKIGLGDVLTLPAE